MEHLKRGYVNSDGFSCESFQRVNGHRTHIYIYIYMYPHNIETYVFVCAHTYTDKNVLLQILRHVVVVAVVVEAVVVVVDVVDDFVKRN